MCKSQVNGEQTHRSKGNGYERQPLSVFGVGSLNSPASLFLKNHIKIAPTRLSYKFRGGCLSRLPREAQVAKQSGNGESREERKTSSSRKREREGETKSSNRVARFQTRTTSFPRICTVKKIRPAMHSREAAGPNCFCVELKKNKK